MVRREGNFLSGPNGSSSSGVMVDPSRTHPGGMSTDPSITHPSRAHHEGDFSSNGEMLNHLPNGTRESPGFRRVEDNLRTHPGGLVWNPSLTHHEGNVMNRGEMDRCGGYRALEGWWILHGPIPVS